MAGGSENRSLPVHSHHNSPIHAQPTSSRIAQHALKEASDDQTREDRVAGGGGYPAGLFELVPDLLAPPGHLRAWTTGPAGD